MSSVYKEAEFFQFMQENGPNSEGGKRNYISWLRYVTEQHSDIDDSLNETKINNIYSWLRESRNSRSIYTSDSAISDIKSALNKYLAFNSSSKNDFSYLTNDIASILGKDFNTSIKQEIEARIGQGKYRKELIKIWKKCSVTKHKQINFLIASHIKPWKECNNIEKVDPYNGLLLLPNLDKLFDKGYISFSEKGNIIASKLITTEDLQLMGLSEDMKLYMVNKRNIPYLKHHREHILLK